MQGNDQVLEVWGDLACFTRPEMKVERFSYPVITPSAARGIYDAIYCKPREFRWQITAIELLKPPRYIALRRNEVKEKISFAKVKAWMSGREHPEPLLADAASEGGDATKGRTQRQTMALKDVRYRLHAQMRPWPGCEDRLPALEAQFRRRAGQGKCVYQPCFGCREFPAYFELVEPGAAVTPPIAEDLDIGLMLYDVFDLSRPGDCHSLPRISLFSARVVQGRLEVPDYESEAVRKSERRDG